MNIGLLAVSNILVCVLSIYIFTKFTSENTEPTEKQNISHDSNETFNTMHWCFGQQSKMCHFQSLCYQTIEDQFVYMTDLASLNEVKSTFHSLSFSSVNELDVFSFVPVFMHRNISLPNVRWLDGDVILFKRFKPDNIMHVLHDDVIPLYHTIKFLGNRNLKLLFMDNYSQGPYDQLYRLFFDVKYKPTAPKQDFLCFKNAFIGVSYVSKWYQYGYHGNVQGPVINEELSSFHLQSVASSILKKLKSFTDTIYQCNQDYLVLFSRTDTRKILNEKEFISTLELITKMKILVIRDDDISEIVHTLRASRGIIGMHGASLVLGSFLKPGSILIELFPYAVNPENYTPYQTLAGIPGMSIIYHSWRNTDKDRSVSHPEYPPEEGGIRHLPEEIQAEIMDQDEVPLHSCCNDPSWLFHINQDTIVDVEKVANITQEALIMSQQLMHVGPQTFSMEPSVVRNLHCSCVGDTLSLNWEHPWNLDYMQNDGVQYRLGIQSRKTKKYNVYIVSVNSYEIARDIDCDYSFDVWVNAEINGIHGALKYIEC